MYVSVVIIAVKQAMSRLNVYGVKIEHTVGGQNLDFFSKCISVVMPAEKLATTKVKTAKKKIRFCPSNFNSIH